MAIFPIMQKLSTGLTNILCKKKQTSSWKGWQTVHEGYVLIQHIQMLCGILERDPTRSFRLL